MSLTVNTLEKDKDPLGVASFAQLDTKPILLRNEMTEEDILVQRTRTKQFSYLIPLRIAATGVNAPTETTISSIVPVLQFANGATEIGGTAFTIPQEWEFVGLDLLWSTPASGSGGTKYAALTIAMAGCKPGESITKNNPTYGSVQVATTVAGNILIKTPLIKKGASGSVIETDYTKLQHAGALFSFYLLRSANSNPNDTLAASFNVHGLVLTVR